MGKFGPKNQNCQLNLKFGTKTNMQNSLLLFWTENTLFGQICSQDSKLSVQAEILVPRLIRIAEFNGDIHFFSVLDCKYPFWAYLVQKIKNCQFKLKFGT